MNTSDVAPVQSLERFQVLVYAVAVAVGGGAGYLWPALGDLVGGALWPALALLLLATFLQVPLVGLKDALREPRPLGALLAGNFALVPLAVWGLSQLAPDDPQIRLAVVLVLLAPCTDWFNSFAQLGRGDARLSLAATPILLAAQLIALPLWLWVFLGAEASAGMQASPFLRTFVVIILVPLAIAGGVQAIAKRREALARAVERSAQVPIVLLALVLLIITASEIGAVTDAGSELARVALVFVAYLIIAPLLAIAVARVFRITGAAERTVVFSLGSRNSLVMLPLVIAWPGTGALAAAVVVTQSLVELVGLVIYVALVPRWIGRPRGRVSAG
jgi:arsenite transporter